MMTPTKAKFGPALLLIGPSGIRHGLAADMGTVRAIKWIASDDASLRNELPLDHHAVPELGRGAGAAVRAGAGSRRMGALYPDRLLREPVADAGPWRTAISSRRARRAGDTEPMAERTGPAAPKTSARKPTTISVGSSTRAPASNWSTNSRCRRSISGR